MRLFNPSGDAVEFFVFCNTKHGVEPTQLVECPVNREHITAPEYLIQGTKLRCPVCLKEVIFVEAEMKERLS